MTHISNTKKVVAFPPISEISRNKNRVVFKDKKDLKSISFKDSIETKNFINWLLTI